jgi:hypothetical protein
MPEQIDVGCFWASLHRATMSTQRPEMLISSVSGSGMMKQTNGTDTAKFDKTGSFSGRFVVSERGILI